MQTIALHSPIRSIPATDGLHARRVVANAVLITFGVVLLFLWSIGASQVDRGRPLVEPQPIVAPAPIH